MRGQLDSMSPAEGRRGALTRLGPRLSLARILIMRDITGRYRGSVLGILWSLITPLLMLAVYTFVFRTVLGARWSETSTQTGTSGFAIILFAGLIVFQLFAEVVTRAPTLVLSNVSFAKRMVFPLEVLPAVALGSALFHAAVSLLMLLAFMRSSGTCHSRPSGCHLSWPLSC